MIPSTTNRLLVTEDWKKIYQSYRNADFKSYDFETLRRTMIAYLREQYPEDFNDYIDSSEYLALIDLIAFLGQNFSFRVDLNARENFIETAERRDSVIRLAQLINYNAKRNLSANGFLKIVAVSTNDAVTDANNNLLTGQTITWNDPTNPNWYQQFISVLNSAMPGNTIFGRPYDSAVINGIEHDQYRIASISTDVPIFNFNANVNGTGMNFEIVSSIFNGKNYVYEEPPKPGNSFAFLYKNDYQGNSSPNTGFFVHFRQGTIGFTNFTIDVPTPNQLIAINAPNINNTDVWLWQLNVDSSYPSQPWTKVVDLVGNNIIYNSLDKSIRDVYAVLTREDDQIDLSFSDGSFGNLPKGTFSLFYRQSNGLAYTIKPDQLANITISIPYTNKSGQPAALTMIVSLQETISNSAVSETNDDIKLKAPQNYYLQNRMITAEDYNIAPLTFGSDILKIKSINRVSSGVSKYYELSDVSGQYSHTNIYGNDGVLYKKYLEENYEFNFVNQNEILGNIKNQLAPIVFSYRMKNFYLDQYPRIENLESEFSWYLAQQTTNQSKGYFQNINGAVPVGDFSGNGLEFIKPGALIKFTAPPGQYFLPNNTFTSIKDTTTKTYIWSKVVNVVGDGFNNGLGLLDDGTGPVTLTSNIPNGAIISQIIPKFINVLPSGIERQMINLCLGKRNFGLSFDSTDRAWFIILDSNLDLTSAFSLAFQKNTNNIGKDSSWMIAYEWTGRNYKVRYRILDYVFESEEETAFFVDKTKKNYDFVNDTVIKDRIRVLGVNSSVAQDSIVTTIPVAFTSIYTTATTAETYAFAGTPTSVLYITNSGNTVIEKEKYFVIHPFIVSGSAKVYDAGPSAVEIVSTLTQTIPAGSLLTFVPTTLTANTTTIFTAGDIVETFSVGKDHNWQVDSAVVENDGFIDPKKINISFYDNDDDGQLDDPDSFDIIVQPTSLGQNGFRNKFVFFKQDSTGNRYFVSRESILSFPTEDDVASPVDQQLYYFYHPDINLVKKYSAEFSIYELQTQYEVYYGRTDLKFQYVHNTGQERRLDPSKTNLIDVYILTKSYDLNYRNWLKTREGEEPSQPTSQALEEQFTELLEPIKAISDEIIYQPVKYKALFGSLASTSLQATFKAVRNNSRPTSDNDLKTRILSAIEEFFAIGNWDFGQTFYFSELSTFVMNKLTPDIYNFVIVPKSTGSFGSLYEITCLGNEIFVNAATVDDIEIIDALTVNEIKAAGSITTTSAGV